MTDDMSPTSGDMADDESPTSGDMADDESPTSGAAGGGGIPTAAGGPDRLAEVAGVLLAKRADLLARMAGISAAPTDQGDISFGKRVGDGTSIAVERLTQVAAHEQMLEQLAEVDRALEKLEEATYGTCDVCGAAIPEGRLEVHPTATTCVTCAG